MTRATQALLIAALAASCSRVAARVFGHLEEIPENRFGSSDRTLLLERNSCQESPYCDTYQERGGNLTITVIEATGLEDLDGYGPAASLSDPYVKIILDNTTRVSSSVRNSLNPIWPAGGEDMFFGVKSSNDEMIVEVWDKDSGLEFDDDLLANATTRVISCSCFHVPDYTVKCTDVRDPLTGQQASCDGQCTQAIDPNTNKLQQCGDDSVCENSPDYCKIKSKCTADACVEESWIPLVEGANCKYRTTWPWGNMSDPSAPCLRVKMRVVPFVIEVKPFLDTRSFPVTVAGAYADSQGNWGKPYEKGSDRIDADFYAFETLLGPDEVGGPMMIQVGNNDKNERDPNYLSFTTNFDAELYVFRKTPDIGIPKVSDTTLPKWLDNENYTMTDIFGMLAGEPATEDNMFRALRRNITRKEVIKVGTNGQGVKAVDDSTLDANPSSNMMLVVKMLRDADPPPPKYTTDFNRDKFFMPVVAKTTIIAGHRANTFRLRRDVDSMLTIA